MSIHTYIYICLPMFCCRDKCVHFTWFFMLWWSPNGFLQQNSIRHTQLFNVNFWINSHVLCLNCGLWTFFLLLTFIYSASFVASLYIPFLICDIDSNIIQQKIIYARRDKWQWNAPNKKTTEKFILLYSWNSAESIFNSIFITV